MGQNQKTSVSRRRRARMPRSAPPQVIAAKAPVSSPPQETPAALPANSGVKNRRARPTPTVMLTSRARIRAAVSSAPRCAAPRSFPSAPRYHSNTKFEFKGWGVSSEPYTRMVYFSPVHNSPLISLFQRGVLYY